MTEPEAASVLSDELEVDEPLTEYATADDAVETVSGDEYLADHPGSG